MDRSEGMESVQEVPEGLIEQTHALVMQAEAKPMNLRETLTHWQPFRPATRVS
jgi:hypothetical protein